MTENPTRPEREKKQEFPSPGGISWLYRRIYEQGLDFKGSSGYLRNDSDRFEPTINPEEEDPDKAKHRIYRVLENLPWKPAGTSDEVKWLDDTALFNQLVGFYQLHIDFRDPRYYPVLAAWTLSTWLRENWRVYGPLYLLGPIESGKTTALECLHETTYRGIRGGSMSMAWTNPRPTTRTIRVNEKP